MLHIPNPNEAMASESGCGAAQSLCILRLVASGSRTQKELWAVARIQGNPQDGSAYLADPSALGLRYKLIFLAFSILWSEGKAIGRQAIASLGAQLYRRGQLRSHR
jgi:hypothetical protein